MGADTVSGGFLGILYASVREARRRAHGGSPLKLDLPVVSIGALQAGGAGKTPVAVALCRALQEEGLLVGVAIQGVGGRLGRGDTPPKLSAPGSTLSVKDAGDEAVLLRREAPGAVLAVGRDRITAATALAKGGVDFILLEDGFQWSGLHRDLDLVVVSGAPGGETVLPKGRLREWPSAYGRADALLIMPGANTAFLDEWAPGGTRFSLSWGSPRWETLDHNATTAPPPNLPLCAAIADPNSLLEELRAEGLDPLLIPFPDHAPMDAHRNRMLREARAYGGVILTTKDAARWGDALEGIPTWVRTRTLLLPSELIQYVLATTPPIPTTPAP